MWCEMYNACCPFVTVVEMTTKRVLATVKRRVENKKKYNQQMNLKSSQIYQCLQTSQRRRIILIVTIIVVPFKRDIYYIFFNVLKLSSQYYKISS